jgi:hypothetical protein
MNGLQVIVALAANSWGRASVALEIARGLREMGDPVAFITDESLVPYFSTESYRCETIPRHLSSIAHIYIDHLMLKLRPGSVIFCDYFSNANVLDSWGVEPKALLFKDIPSTTVDTWNFFETGPEIDVFDGQLRQMGPGTAQQRREQFSAITYKMRPVPIIATKRVSGAFSSLPPETRSGRKRLVVDSLGLDHSARLVLFCTADWQQPKYATSHPGRRLSEMLPVLLAEYLMRVGPEVHLVHVGPRAFDLRGRLEGRYHWQAPLSPGEFDRLLSGADLLVSANISATTITKAMVYEVPVLVLQNSVSGQSRSEAEAGMAAPPSPWMSAWLDEAVPFYPFALWPLGYHRFLAPLLSQNPYVKALEIVEMLDEAGVESALHGLLFDPVRRAEQAHRQAAYLMQVRSLPTGAQLIKANLAGGNRNGEISQHSCHGSVQ